jgi:hypothetical protein
VGLRRDAEEWRKWTGELSRTEGGGSGRGGAGGLNRWDQDDGGAQPVEWRHGAQAPCGTWRPVAGAGTASSATTMSTRCLRGARSEQGKRRLPGGMHNTFFIYPKVFQIESNLKG